MSEPKIGELLLDLALLFVLTYLLAAFLERRLIPGILAELFVAYAKEYSADGSAPQSSVFTSAALRVL